MAKRTKSLRCPTCRTIVHAKDEHFPFCSDRCRTIDLGKLVSDILPLIQAAVSRKVEMEPSSRLVTYMVRESRLM